MWTVKFRDGQMKRFKYPIRTTQWGSIDPYKDAASPAPGELKNQLLYGEPKWLMVDQLPVLASN